MGRFEGYNLSHLQIFVNELFTGLNLGWVKWIDFGNMGGECWLKVNGVVVMVVRW